MNGHLFSIYLFSILVMSCSQTQKGKMISQTEVDTILEEEIDDNDLEMDINDLRNSTKMLLDIELLKKSGLKEIYVPEEPLAINFLDQYENLLSFENISLNESEFDNYFYLVNPANKNEIKELKIDYKSIKYSVDSTEVGRSIEAIIRCNQTGKFLKMQVFCKRYEEELISQYSKLMICGK